MDETDQNRLTEGSVPRKMLSFALPISLSNLFQQLYNMVDSVVVGNYVGSSALTAVGGAVFNIFIGSLLATMGNVLFAVMGVMHLVTAVILWRMVRHETPKNVK